MDSLVIPATRLAVSFCQQARLVAALTLLQEAQEAASMANVNIWEFAVEIAELHRAGVTTTESRWLVSQGCARSGIETTLSGAASRSFLELANLNMPATTCFVLTPAGLRMGVRLSGEKILTGVPGSGNATHDQPPFRGVPLWNPDLRQLSWQGLLIK